MHSLIDDLSVLTTIPPFDLKKLAEKSKYLICDCVEESTLKGEDLTEIDLGIGTLQIKIENENILYKFIPSLSLNSSVRGTVVDGENPLTDVLEASLVEKITKTYKDLF